MQAIRRLVELALYGIGDQRRFVQDGAIFPEVWIALIEARGKAVPTLVQPYMELPPSQLAQALASRKITRKSNGVVYNNTVVSMRTDLQTLVFGLAPLTRWFAKVAARRDSGERSLTDMVGQALGDDLWLDLPLHREQRADRPEEITEFLSFVRVAGLAAYLALGPKPRGEVRAEARRVIEYASTHRPENALDLMARIVAQGWKLLLAKPARYPTSDGDSVVYSITNDRPAFLAVADSRKTVKADAALRVFEMSCSGLTWAIIDSGIDALHPAFVPSKSQDKDSVSKLQHSRVIKTIDLSFLREILLGNNDKTLPAQVRASEHKARIQAARAQLEEFRSIDWGQLLPLLQIEPAKYTVPLNPHGTHVAGILGADWENGPRGPMQGLCPDIQLIDIRVCKPDGSSDEFVVTSALQLLRYLNANADLMAVHGVNISLSLDHDVANYACGRTPVCLEAERTMASGIVVVAAAGNRGYRHIKAADETTFYQYCAVSITDPGNAAAIITVGSTHRREPHNFGISYFSSRGPTGDGRIKPDIVAPGEKIYAPAPHGEAMTLDGTSMAAPHVCGAAALLLARHPELIGQPARVKQILCESATDLGRERYFQGHGLVDVLRALQRV